jgi:hypothetical protein
MNILRVKIGAVLLVGGNLTSFFANTLWSDDFPFIISSRESFNLAENEVVANGRIVLALGNHYMFKIVDSFGLTILPHFLALAFLLGLYFVVLHNFADVEKKRFAIPLSLGLLTPPFFIFTNWASVWLYNFASLLGVASWMLWYREKKWLSVPLLAAGYLIYPTAALSFLALLPIQLLIRSHARNEAWKKFLSNLFLVISATILTLVINMLLFFFGLLSPAERLRTAPISEIPEKTVWFLSRSLIASLQFVSVVSPDSRTILLLHVPILILFLVMLRIVIKDNIDIVKFIGISSLSISLAQFPHIFGSERQIEFRFLPASTLLITASFFLMLQIVAEKRKYYLVRNFLVTACCIMAVFTNNFRVLDFYNRQYLDKEKFFRAELRSCIGSFNVVLSSSGVLLASRPNLGTFSQLSDMQSSWVATNYIEYRYGQKTEIREGLEVGEQSKIECFIDMSKFKPSNPVLRI